MKLWIFLYNKTNNKSNGYLFCRKVYQLSLCTEVLFPTWKCIFIVAFVASMLEFYILMFWIFLVGIIIFCNKGKLNEKSQDKQHFINISETYLKVPTFMTKNKKLLPSMLSSFLYNVLLSSQKLKNAIKNEKCQFSLGHPFWCTPYTWTLQCWLSCNNTFFKKSSTNQKCCDLSTCCWQLHPWNMQILKLKRMDFKHTSYQGKWQPHH